MKNKWIPKKIKIDLGRNHKPCICGNNVKYKKCCEGDELLNKLTTIDPNPMENHLEGGWWDDDDKHSEIIKHHNGFGWDGFNEKEPIKYISHLSKLDKEVQRKIRLVIKYRPITKGGCFNNSTLLSILIDEVERVNGWIISNTKEEFGRDENDLVFKKRIDGDKWFVSKNPKSLTISDEVNGEGDYELSEWVYDKKTKNHYIKHSWNRVGDIHFDITMKVPWWREIFGWNEYYMSPNQLKPSEEIKEVLLSNYELNEMYNGCINRVINRGVIDDKIFENVGILNGHPQRVKSDYLVYWSDEDKKHQKEKINNLFESN